MGTDRIARSDVVGSLLRPDYLRDARRAVRDGTLAAADLRAVEDRAVREAIALQESAGIDVVTDGELRRNSWVVTIPLREEGARHEVQTQILGVAGARYFGGDNISLAMFTHVGAAAPGRGSDGLALRRAALSS